MCSLEVPDIEHTFVERYGNNDDVMVLLANAGDSAGLVETFLMENQITLSSILDQEHTVYSVYPRDESVYAPFPVNVVIDQEGLIQYLSYQHDLIEVAETIDRLIEDNE